MAVSTMYLAAKISQTGRGRRCYFISLVLAEQLSIITLQSSHGTAKPFEFVVLTPRVLLDRSHAYAWLETTQFKKNGIPVWSG